MRFIGLIGSVALVGCTSADRLPEIPDIGSVYAYVDQVKHLSGAEIVDGADLIAASYVIVDDRCEKFFSLLESEKARLLFAHSTVTDATTTAVEILSLLSAAQRDIGLVAAAGKFVADRIANYNAIYNFAPYSGQLKKLVNEAQADYKNRMGPVMAQMEGRPVSEAKVLFTAENIAQGYGRTCTYSQFQLFIETALGKSAAKVSTNVASDTPGGSVASDQVESSRAGSSGSMKYLPPYVSN